MKKEITIFFTSLMFYTRIPCPKNIDHSPDYLNKATRYFPLIGWIIGILSFLIYLISIQLFTLNLSVLFALAAGVLLTGAFHEDGLADTFDGFGGGWTKEKILEIMKDSRIGTYGTIALVFLFLIKFFGLMALVGKYGGNIFLLGLMFIAYHSLARLTAANLVFFGRYSREDATSKVKPIAKQSGRTEMIVAYIFGLLPLFSLLWYSWWFSVVVIPLFCVFFFSLRYFNKWIDGYTGDCLGAVEQIAELIVILTFSVLWKFM